VRACGAFFVLHSFQVEQCNLRHKLQRQITSAIFLFNTQTMTRLLATSFFLLITTLLSAQSTKWTFGLQLHSGFSYLTYQNELNSYYAARVRDNFLPRFAPGGILTVGYRVAPLVTLQAGIGYWLSGARIREQDLIIVTPDLPEGMYNGTFEGKFHYHDLVAPLYIKACPIANHQRFYLIGGFAGMVKLSRQQTIVFHYLDGTQQTIGEDMTDQYRTLTSLNLRSDLGFGYAFPLGKKMKGFLEPLFGYQVFPVIKEGAGKWGQYFLGLNLGITWGEQ
jgi:hypothetical protein